MAKNRDSNSPDPLLGADPLEGTPALGAPPVVPQSQVEAVQPGEPGAVPQKMVTITPRFDEPRARIGGQWYNFIKGKEMQVPDNVRQVLLERDML